MSKPVRIWQVRPARPYLHQKEKPLSFVWYGGFYYFKLIGWRAIGRSRFWKIKFPWYLVKSLGIRQYACVFHLRLKKIFCLTKLRCTWKRAVFTSECARKGKQYLRIASFEGALSREKSRFSGDLSLSRVSLRQGPVIAARTFYIMAPEVHAVFADLRFHTAHPLLRLIFMSLLWFIMGSP